MFNERRKMSQDVSQAATGELAPDLHYRDKIAVVEPYGVNAIPDSERHGKAVSQFFIWFAAGMNFPIIVLGFLAVSYGLSLTASVTAIVAQLDTPTDGTDVEVLWSTESLACSHADGYDEAES